MTHRFWAFRRPGMLINKMIPPDHEIVFYSTPDGVMRIEVFCDGETFLASISSKGVVIDESVDHTEA